MKKTIIKCCVFAAVFLVSLVTASFVLNRENTDMTAEMSLPRLPLVYVDVDGRHVNMMQGYVSEMDEKYMREGIMPVGNDRKLSFCVKKYGRQIRGLSFQVRSIDGSRLVEDTPVETFREEEDLLYADIVLKELIDEKTEYCLVFKLELEDGQEVSYYTRVIQAEGYQAREKIGFVAEFSESTFREDKLDDLRIYIEPNAEGDNSTLSHVTIHSSLSQIGWGTLEVEQETEPVFTIQDITEQTAAVTVEYLVSYMRFEKERYAAVKEVYRIRTGEERIYLLDYDRQMCELFSEDPSSFLDDQVVLGVRDADVDMVESEDGRMLAFSQAGVLYSLNVTEDKLSRLFSFYDHTGRDERTFFGGHDYKILQVDEAGNVFFMVYGYISRGKHEGTCGVEVYLYNNSTNTIEEMVYIPSDRPPELLSAQIDRLAYINGRNEFYLFISDRISCIHLDDQRVDTIAEGLGVDSAQASESNRTIVWQNDREKYACSSLTMMNLATGEKTVIQAGEGSYILPLGFMGEDLVYGLARQEDLAMDSAGSTIFPMYQLRIQDEAGNVLMSYEKEGVYVTGCEMRENQILLSRVEREADGTYAACEEDQIVSGELTARKANTIVTVPTQEDDRLTQIQLKNGVDGKKLKLLTPKEVLYEGKREAVIEPPAEEVESFYVYDLDGDVTIVSTPREAIELAYANAGTVTGENSAYIWRRERLNTRNQIMAIDGSAASAADTAAAGRNSLAVCLDEILSYEGVTRNCAYLLEQGQSVTQILEESMPDVQVLDLTGCSLENILYYPDREIPVLAMLSDGSAVLVIGFNEKNVVLMDPKASGNPVYKMGMNDAAEWFEENGNVFLSYVRQK